MDSRVEDNRVKTGVGLPGAGVEGCPRPAAPGTQCPTPDARPWRLPRLRVSPLNRRRWQSFKSNRRGFWSLIAFAVLFVLTLCAELIANDKPILLVYKGEVLFPVFVDYPEEKFGGFLATTDYKEPVILDEIQKNGWAIWPPIGYAAHSINKDYPRIKNAEGQCLGFPGPAPWMSSAELCEASAEHLARYHALGATLCEFPLDAPTAKAARDTGCAVIMGAPNIVRGGSHAARFSAHEAFRRGLCSVLTSDYYYPAMHLAAFRLAREGEATLGAAWRAVSTDAARAVALSDRGEIRVGKRADLVLVDDDRQDEPAIAATLAGGRIAYLGDARLLASDVATPAYA